MQNTFFFLLLFHSIFSGFAQSSLPKDYFIPPLDIPLAISGTYGELRSGHFHSGLDVKTQGKEGLAVYASANGVVTRIKVSHYGYGKALYVRHPNGYTTVYAHLQKFAPKIEAYVKKRQYAKESYEIELYPKDETLYVQRQEVIAYSGNSGGSGGPHLHFEIRDAGARPMNPLKFGIEVKDSKKPIIQGAWLYPLDEKSHINGQTTPQKIRLAPQQDGNFKAPEIQAYGKIGIGIATIDKLDLANNKNGVYHISSQINGQKNFELQMDKFSFSETRYINRLVDYKYYRKNKTRITQLFILPNNPLSIYKNRSLDGNIIIKDSLSYVSKVLVKDFNGNTTHIEVPFIGKTMPLPEEKLPNPSLQEVTYNNTFTYHKGSYNVYIPKNGLYENALLDIQVIGDTIKMHKDEIPMHKKMTISYDMSKYKPDDQKKMYLGRLGRNGKHYYTDTYRKGNRISTRTRTMGRYSIFFDHQKPTVIPVNVAAKKWMNQEKYLKMKIHDDETEIKSYRATINGQFILMEYDYKTGMLIYDFQDKIINETENNFRLIVLDKVGNNTTFEIVFYRKPEN